MDKRYSYFALHFISTGSIDLAWSRHSTCTNHAGPVCWAGWPGQYLRFSSRAPRAHFRTALVGEVPAAWQAEGLWPRHPTPVSDVVRAERQWHDYLTCSPCRTPLERRRATNALEAFLLDLAATGQDEAVGPIADLRRAIDADPGRQPDYRAWARHAGVSLATLRRRFLAAYGMPVHRYLLERRCSAARELLRTSTQSLASIAETLGYRDVYYFSRQFRDVVGMPPGAFRRQWPDRYRPAADKPNS